MHTKAVFLASLIPFSWAYASTPVITWSSQRSSVLDNFHPTSSTGILEDLLNHESICHHDAVIIVEQSGLREADLRDSLEPSSRLVKHISDASLSRQFPLTRRSSETSLQDLAAALADRCNAVYADDSSELSKGRKHIIYSTLPALHGTGFSRKYDMQDYEHRLSAHIDEVAAVFTNFLVIYTGSASPSLASRAMSAVSWPGFEIAKGGNSTLPEGGILKRYQLLTPALITSLLISLFILLPIVVIGVQALASIQSPLSTGGDIPKGFDATTKKNQ